MTTHPIQRLAEIRRQIAHLRITIAIPATIALSAFALMFGGQ